MEGRFPRQGRLVAIGEPQTVRPRVLPEHRLCTVRLRNEGAHSVELERSDLRLIGTDGERIPAVPSIAPNEVVAILPGAELELHFAWRGDAQPAEVRHGSDAIVLALAPVR